MNPFFEICAVNECSVVIGSHAKDMVQAVLCIITYDSSFFVVYLILVNVFVSN